VVGTSKELVNAYENMWCPIPGDISYSLLWKSQI